MNDHSLVVRHLRHLARVVEPGDVFAPEPDEGDDHEEAAHHEVHDGEHQLCAHDALIR